MNDRSILLIALDPEIELNKNSKWAGFVKSVPSQLGAWSEYVFHESRYLRAGIILLLLRMEKSEWLHLWTLHKVEDMSNQKNMVVNNEKISTRWLRDRMTTSILQQMVLEAGE